ncbi:MAG: TetR/AcrR family transcriptional regulator [Spirochaetales bacterium]
MARLENLTDRGLETQQVFRDAFLALVVEKGYDAVTVKDITDRAGLERTTFYLHFKGKEDLLERAQNALVQDLAEPNPANEGLAIRRLFQTVAANRMAFRALLRLDAAGRVGKRMFERSVRVVLESGGVERVVPEGVVNRELAAIFIASTLRSVVFWWAEQDTPPPADEAADTAFRMITQGVGALRKPN